MVQPDHRPPRLNSGAPFPPEELVEPENFLSLLSYFGLLSIHGESHGPGCPEQPSDPRPETEVE